MRRFPLILASITVAACGGRSTAPEPATPATSPAARTPTTGDPATLRYAAGTSRYRIETTFHSTTEIMGNTQVADGSLLQLVTVTLAQQGDGYTARFTLDSVALTGQTPPGAGDPAILKGKVFNATLGSNGRTLTVTSADSANLAVAAAAEGVREFFPTLPGGPLTAGSSWTDTVSSTNRQPGNTVRSQSVRQHRVVGWETRDGARVLHLSSAGNTVLDGEGEAQGQAIQLRGAGSGTADRYVSSAGVFVGQNASDSTNIQVTVISMGLEVPVRTTRRSVITRLP